MASMVGGHPNALNGIRVLWVPSSPFVPATAVTRTHPKRCLPPLQFSRPSQSMSPVKHTRSQINVANSTYRDVAHVFAMKDSTAAHHGHKASTRRPPAAVITPVAHDCSPHTGHDTANNPNKLKQ